MVHTVISQLSTLDRPQLEQVISELVIMAGMTPLKQLAMPPPVEGVPWTECWERGLDRIERLGRKAAYHRAA
jgi:hypothetical protein